jgi:hypothetical protein
MGRVTLLCAMRNEPGLHKNFRSVYVRDVRICNSANYTVAKFEQSFNRYYT